MYESLGISITARKISEGQAQKYIVERSATATGADEDGETKTVAVELTRGLFALIDEQDLEIALRHLWYASTPTNSSVRSYPRTNVWINGKRKPVALHTILMATERVDHINGNGLDNRRRNLRPADRSQNGANVGKRIHMGYSSAFKGVSLCTDRPNTWIAKFGWRGKEISRRFKNEKEAALYYNEIALKHAGEFAVLNSI